MDLPEAPKRLRDMIGPSLVLLGLGLGSGEIILWPYLSSNHGLGMIWAIAVGITMQFFINMEVERYALIYGESIFVGFAKWSRILPMWFMISTILGFGWPGIGLSAATLLTQATNFGNPKIWGIILFLIIGLTLTLGKQLYATVETLQKYLIGFGTPTIIILALWLARPGDEIALIKGLVGIGNNYYFLPKDIVMATFLGALAFAGAGGNLNLAQSFYIRDKGYGMGKFADKIKRLITNNHKNEEMKLEGQTFTVNKDNMQRFKEWWRMVNLEHLLIFWGLGLVTIISLSFLAYVTTYGHPGNPEGINFVINEANFIGQKIAPLVGILFLLIAGLMLTATQLTVLDSTSRIVTENFLLFKKEKIANVAGTYYAVLWLQILMGAAIIWFGKSQPKDLVVLSACINAFAMFIYTALILYLNNTKINKALRPSWWRNAILGITFIFYGVFGWLTLVG